MDFSSDIGTMCLALNLEFYTLLGGKKIERSDALNVRKCDIERGLYTI